MVYMVHLTNQMAMKAPVPNIEEILRTNPDIARQMAAQAMQTQTQQFRQQVNVPTYTPPPPQPRPQQPQQPANNPLAGLMSFLGGTTQPAPQPQAAPKPVVREIREMKPPSGMGIGDILKGIQSEEKKVGKPSPPAAAPAPTKSALKKVSSGDSVASGGSRKSPKNSVVIKL
jgi:hypothetical protein